MLKWLKHAFAVETDQIAIPNATQSKVIDMVCHEIIRRGMTFPTQMLLETSAPMHFLSGQMLRIAEPVLGAIIDQNTVREFATFVERKGAIEYICRRLDQLQSTGSSSNQSQ